MSNLKPTIGHLNESSPRASAWRDVFGGLEIPLESPLMRKVELPIGVREVYMLDVKKLTADVRKKLVGYLAKRFQIPAGEVDRDLESNGVPILIEDVSVSFDPRLIL